MKKYDLIIIGGGASGLIAAIAAKRRNGNKSVLILEAQAKLGKKILVSGNGRCNILNTGSYQYFGDVDFAYRVLGDHAYDSLKAFFENLGLPIVIESEHRAYPASFQAETVMDVIQLQLQRLGVEYCLENPVVNIKQQKNSFVIETDKSEYLCSKLILAVGGLASPKHGSNGSLHGAIKKLGFHFLESKPSLCPILCNTKETKVLSGLRVRAKIQIDDSYSAKGEVLFTDYGLSGIATMQLARFYRPGSIVRIDLRSACGMDEKTREELFFVLKNRVFGHGEEGVQNLLTGLFPKKLAKVLLQKAGISPKILLIKEVKQNHIHALVNYIMDFTIEAKGVKGYDFAQVSTGGVDCSQVNPHTMESKIPNLYIVGELLNIDGECGGFNLMFAFQSGRIAGSHASEE